MVVASVSNIVCTFPVCGYNGRMQLISCPDIKDTIALLEGANLPTADVTPDLLKHFIGTVSDGALTGVVGYESHDQIGLLRSLAVAPAARRLGLAARLIKRIEHVAHDNGIKTFYLLTTDADGYFARRGYTVVSRSDLPASIRATAQFSSLCPGSATPMIKAL